MVMWNGEPRLLMNHNFHHHSLTQDNIISTTLYMSVSYIHPCFIKLKGYPIPNLIFFYLIKTKPSSFVSLSITISLFLKLTGFVL